MTSLAPYVIAMGVHRKFCRGARIGDNRGGKFASEARKTGVPMEHVLNRDVITTLCVGVWGNTQRIFFLNFSLEISVFLRVL